LKRIFGCEGIEEQGLIERYVVGLLSEAAAEAFEEHYLTCARCQEELRLAYAIRATLPGVREISSPNRELEVAAEEEVAVFAEGRGGPSGRERRVPRRLRGRAVATLAAAAVLAGLLLLRPSGQDEESALIHREDVAGEETPPAPLAPVGEVAVLEEFRWSPVPLADVYRITVYDAAGEVVLEVETRQTRLAPPVATELEPNSRYLWKVAARVGWDRWVSSGLVEFTISEP
jgi:hypothetical protein